MRWDAKGGRGVMDSRLGIIDSTVGNIFDSAVYETSFGYNEMHLELMKGCTLRKKLLPSTYLVLPNGIWKHHDMHIGVPRTDI